MSPGPSRSNKIGLMAVRIVGYSLGPAWSVGCPWQKMNKPCSSSEINSTETSKGTSTLPNKPKPNLRQRASEPRSADSGSHYGAKISCEDVPTQAPKPGGEAELKLRPKREHLAGYFQPSSVIPASPSQSIQALRLTAVGFFAG